MPRGRHLPSQNQRFSRNKQRLRPARRIHQQALPPAAYRQRGGSASPAVPFNAPERWYEPTNRDSTRYIVQPPGKGYWHAVEPHEIRERIAQLPSRFQQGIEVVHLGQMTRKRALFPCYGMQWGPNIYLYPIEESLVEYYVRAPRPEQVIEASMYGGVWAEENGLWRLTWTPDTIKDFYLNNVLIHEIGHLHDQRNSGYRARENYANWFAIEYGYRASRGRN